MGNRTGKIKLLLLSKRCQSSTAKLSSSWAVTNLGICTGIRNGGWESEEDGVILLRKEFHYVPFLGTGGMVWEGELVGSIGQVENGEWASTKPFSRVMLGASLCPPITPLPHKTSTSHPGAPTDIESSGIWLGVSAQHHVQRDKVSPPWLGVAHPHGSRGKTPTRVTEANPVGFLRVGDLSKWSSKTLNSALVRTLI